MVRVLLSAALLALTFSLPDAVQLNPSKTQAGDWVSNLAIVIEKSDCVSRDGPTWHFAGPSGLAQNAGLCVQHDPSATLAVTAVGFVLTQTSSHRQCVTNGTDASANIIQQSPGASAADGCAQLGEGFQLVEGHLDSAGPSKCAVHMCTKKQIAAQQEDHNLFKNMAVFRYATAHLSACAPGMASQHETLKLPGLDNPIMDDPTMMCLTRASVVEEMPSAIEQKSIAQGDFPVTSMSVPHDTGNSSREHIFVVGPETSGTRLWTHMIASGMGLTDAEFENFQYNSDVAIFHVSLPWGRWCGRDVLPVYDDFGGDTKSYSLAPESCTELNTPPSAGRFYIAPLPLIKHYKERGERVKVAMVARDPRASFAGKMATHCSDADIGAAEQTKAFEVMLAAHDAGVEEAVTICYEEMFEDSSYVASRLDKLGATPKSMPELVDGNDKYELEAVECSYDMLAYATLCPHTKLGKMVEASCQ